MTHAESIIHEPMRAPTLPLTRQPAELDGDLSTTRARICEALAVGCGIGVICRRHFGSWSLATRSILDPSAWPACETRDQVRVAVCERVETFRVSKSGSVACDPNSHVIGSLIHQLDPLPVLPTVETISSRPVWSGGRWQGSPEGEYDPDLRVITCLDVAGVEAQRLLASRAAYRADPEALRELASEAVEVLGRVCEGADWLAPCDRSAWLTCATAAATRMLWASPNGSPSPMLLVRSPDSGQGGGKSTLAHAVGLIAGGSSTLSTEGVDAGEIQRQLAPLLADRTPVIVCDEIGSLREAGVIDTYWHEVLTAKSIAVRLVGSSKRLVTENHSVFVATGIEPSYRGNTRRRVIPARLGGPADPAGAAARHGLDPLAYCRAHAAELWAACATIVWAYQQAGEPSVECAPRRPSYEDWDRVRRAIVWAGGGDCLARPSGEEEDDQPALAGQLLLEQVRDALIGLGLDHITYRQLAPHVGLRPENRGDAMRFSHEVRRSAWPEGYRVAWRKVSGTGRYLIERRSDSGWTVWQPGDPLAVSAATSDASIAVIEQAGQPDEPGSARQVLTDAWPITISVGVGRSDKTTSDPHRVATTIAELLEAVGVEREGKGRTYFCPGYREDTEDLETYPRRIAELESADLVAFDFDESTGEQIGAMLLGLAGFGIAHLAHTSYSHTPKQPRIRLVVFPERPIDRHEYRATWQHLADQLESRYGVVADRAPSHIASVLYHGQPTGCRLPDASVLWSGTWPADIGARGAIWIPGTSIAIVKPPTEQAGKLIDLSARVRQTLAGGSNRSARASAYLSKVPRTTHTGDLYALVCRVGDLVNDEIELREAILAWSARTAPTHSTGEPYTAREFARLLDDAIRYRQTGLGSEP